MGLLSQDEVGRMPEYGSPTVRRRRLAAELRRLRERASLTGEEVAEQLGWSASKVSRIETYRSGVKAADLSRLLQLYGVSAAHQAELLELGREPRRKGWWEAYSDALPEEYAAYIVLEAEAESMQCWSPVMVHGLLQTADYARAVIEDHMGSTASIPPGKIRQRVATRLERQQAITSERALGLSVVLDQSVLIRKVGDAAVMRQQMEHLIEVSRLPNVRLRVLPLSGAHPIGTGGFALLHFQPVPGIRHSPDVVYLEQLGRNALYVEDEDEVFEYRQAFGKLAEGSLGPAGSRQAIAAAARETWS
jgi:transcriptional regulator with XRE-family HTH domain